MQRFVPRLHIAIVSGCARTALALGERIDEYGQLAQVFASAGDLCQRAELQALDIVLFDRRRPGFAMGVSAVRALIRQASGYAMLCGFGPAHGIAPIGLDYEYDAAISDGELCSLLAEAMCGLDDGWPGPGAGSQQGFWIS